MFTNRSVLFGRQRRCIWFVYICRRRLETSNDRNLRMSGCLRGYRYGSWDPASDQRRGKRLEGKMLMAGSLRSNSLPDGHMKRLLKVRWRLIARIYHTMSTSFARIYTIPCQFHSHASTTPMSTSFARIYAIPCQFHSHASTIPCQHHSHASIPYHVSFIRTHLLYHVNIIGAHLYHTMSVSFARTSLPSRRVRLYTATPFVDVAEKKLDMQERILLNSNAGNTRLLCGGILYKLQCGEY